ncbi:MAG: nucleoside triphosphate pyrophosphohydrolase [Patescibacteria group bacterium]|nr:nucleoside triphosphate pyrophosphohydrolase [Patescibacteria group bacterium]
MKTYNKLVRDRIPEIIKADGENPKTRILDDTEYKKELLKKAVEEANELLAAGEDKKELIKEIGDIEEVLEYIIKSFNLDGGEIEKLKSMRKEKRGGFDKRIFLECTEKV